MKPLSSQWIDWMFARALQGHSFIWHLLKNPTSIYPQFFIRFIYLPRYLIWSFPIIATPPPLRNINTATAGASELDGRVFPEDPTPELANRTCSSDQLSGKAPGGIGHRGAGGMTWSPAATRLWSPQRNASRLTENSGARAPPRLSVRACLQTMQGSGPVMGSLYELPRKTPHTVAPF